MNNSVNVEQVLHTLYFKVTHPYNDGFTQWHNKQKLIDIKYMLDDLLSKTPTFGELETDYIKTKEQEKLIGILKK